MRPPGALLPAAVKPSGILLAVGLAATLGFLLLELAGLHAGYRDYDEGVYWQSLRALGRGEPLFRSVFASEPPAFYYALLPFYAIGHGIAAIRLGVLVLAAGGLAAVYLAGRCLAGSAAGLVALALTATAPFYLDQASVLQADAPGMALALMAVAAGLYASSAGGRAGVALAALAGFLLALSVGTKLSGVLAAVPVLLAIAGNRHTFRANAASLVAGGLLGTGIVLLPIYGAWSIAYRQLVHSHLGAGQLAHRSVSANLRLLLLGRELPLEALAAAGAAIALVRRDRRVLLPLAWTVVTVIAILLYEPLFPHHLVQLVPPLALLTAVGWANLPGLRPSAALAGAALVGLAAAYGLTVGVRHTAAALRAGVHEVSLANSLREHSSPQDFVISDNAYAVALADRDIPGPAVDTSRQLIATGLIDLPGLSDAARRYHVRLVLVDGDRLMSVPGFADWLAAHFTTLQTLGAHAALYRGSAS